MRLVHILCGLKIEGLKDVFKMKNPQNTEGAFLIINWFLIAYNFTRFETHVKILNADGSKFSVDLIAKPINFPQFFDTCIPFLGERSRLEVKF